VSTRHAQHLLLAREAAFARVFDQTPVDVLEQVLEGRVAVQGRQLRIRRERAHEVVATVHREPQRCDRSLPISFVRQSRGSEVVGSAALRVVQGSIADQQQLVLVQARSALGLERERERQRAAGRERRARRTARQPREASESPEQATADQSGQDEVEVAVGHREVERQQLRHRSEGPRRADPPGRLVATGAQRGNDPPREDRCGDEPGERPRIEERADGVGLVIGGGADTESRERQVARSDRGNRERVDPDVGIRHRVGAPDAVERRELREDVQCQHQRPQHEALDVARIGCAAAAPGQRLRRHHRQREDGRTLGRQCQREERRAEPWPAAKGEQCREREREREHRFELGDPRNRLDVRRMEREQNARQQRRADRDARRSQQHGEQRGVQRVKQDVDDVIAGRRVAQQAPLEHVGGHVNRGVVAIRVLPLRTDRVDERP